MQHDNQFGFNNSQNQIKKSETRRGRDNIDHEDESQLGIDEQDQEEVQEVENRKTAKF